jgi:cell division protein FtsW (lipid II flippase)
VNEYIAVTENDAPKQYKLSPFILVIAIAFLAIGEALAGTSVYFVAMMASTMLCIGITYNILGGLGSIGGIAFSIFALNTFVISQFAKVILFESAIQNLEAPQLTITVYLLFYFSVMVGTFVFGRARLPLPKALEPSTDKQMNLMYLFSLVVGTLATFIFAGGELLTGGGDEGTSHSFAVGFQGLLLFAVVLAVQSRLRRSNGLHSVDMKVLIPWIVLIVFGLLNTERAGVIRPAFAYALTCHLNGFEFKRKHYIWAVAGIVAFVTIISPYFIYERQLGLGLARIIREA